MTRKTFQTILGALILTTVALPALADDSRDNDYRYSNRYDRDMDRYGRDDHDRGYRLGRSGQRSDGDRDRYSTSYGRDFNWWSDYDSGYRRGRDDERRYGSRDRRSQGDRESD